MKRPGRIVERCISVARSEPRTRWHRPQRVGSVLVALGLACAMPVAADEQEPATPEVLFLDPATGSRLAKNPADVRVKVRHTRDLPHLVFSSDTGLYVVPTAHLATRFPLYWWSDGENAVQLAARAAPDADPIATTDYRLPPVDLDDVEGIIGEWRVAFASAPDRDALAQTLADALTDAERLVEAGHPIFASILARDIDARIQQVEPRSQQDAETTADGAPEGPPPRSVDSCRAAPESSVALRAVALRLRLTVILGRPPEDLVVAVEDVLSCTPDRRTAIRLAADTQRIALLALVSGYTAETAEHVMDAGNHLAAHAGRLPRRLPSGF